MKSEMQKHLFAVVAILALATTVYRFWPAASESQKVEAYECCLLAGKATLCEAIPVNDIKKLFQHCAAAGATAKQCMSIGDTVPIEMQKKENCGEIQTRVNVLMGNDP